jgi:hypothetical protein
MAGLTIYISLTCYVILFNLVLSQAPKDPVRSFCRRFSHQTAVIDRQLYIDGGYVNASPLSQNLGQSQVKHAGCATRSMALFQLTLNPDSNLLNQNLDVVQNGMPVLSANLSKNDIVPSVTGGILWPDDGTKSSISTAESSRSSWTILSFGPTTYS